MKLKYETSIPLHKPTKAPTKRQIIIAIEGGTFLLTIKSANTIPVNPTVAPADKSIPPPIMQKNIPAETIETIETCLNTLSKLLDVRNESVIMLSKINRKITM